MKRSEMLKLIEGLFDLAPNFPNEINAENLLSHLEQKGMLPPTICYNSIGEYENIKDTDILHDCDVSFSWEPEE